MIYTCTKCQKIFDQKSHYIVHINRKFSCLNNYDIVDTSEIILPQKTAKNHIKTAKNHINPQNIITNIEDINNDIISTDNTIKQTYLCEYCNTSYSRKDVLSRHIKQYCKLKNKIDNTKLNNDVSEIIKSKEEITELKKEIQNLKQQFITTSKIKSKLNDDNKQIINNGQIINNNFNIVTFGEEDIKKLTEEEKLRVLKSRGSAFIDLVKMVHLNERLPEFHNVLINNIKAKYGSIIDNNKLIIAKKDKIIADIVSCRLSDLKDLATEYKMTKHLTRREKTILDDIITYFDHYYLEDV